MRGGDASIPPAGSTMPPTPISTDDTLALLDRAHRVADRASFHACSATVVFLSPSLRRPSMTTERDAVALELDPALVGETFGAPLEGWDDIARIGRSRTEAIVEQVPAS